MLTAACYEHRRHINTPPRRQELLDLIFEQFISVKMEIVAWVVLDNHYHLLVYVPDFDLLGPIFKQIHGSLAYKWNGEDNTRGRRVWYRYSDRMMRSDAHYYRMLNYIHYNPVKHGLVKSPYDWTCSSVHWYLEEKGRAWLRDVWVQYPVRNFGEGWDDMGKLDD